MAYSLYSSDNVDIHCVGLAKAEKEDKATGEKTEAQAEPSSKPSEEPVSMNPAPEEKQGDILTQR